MTVSVEEAQQYAVEHNLNLANSSLAVKQAHATRWQTIAQMLPQATGNLSYSNNFGYEIEIGEGMAMSMPSSGTLTVTASMALSAYNIVAAIINTQAIQMSDIQLKKSSQTINTNVYVTYISILVAEENLKLLYRNLENMEYLLMVSVNSTKVGVTEQYETDQIRVQVAQYKNSITTAERSRNVLYNTLKLYMGAEPDQPIALKQTLAEALNMDEFTAILGTEFRMEDNYDYQLQAQNTEQARKQMVQSAMRYVPSLSASYSYTTKTYFGEEAGFNMQPPHSMSVSLSVPLWTSGQYAAGVTSAKLSYLTQRNTLAYTEDQLRLQDSQYRYTLSNAIDDYYVQKDNVEVTEGVLQNTSKKFEYGYSAATDVTTASQNLITAQTNYTSAIYTMVEAYMNLKNLINQQQ